jgi:hypothetical protein
LRLLVALYAEIAVLLQLLRTAVGTVSFGLGVILLTLMKWIPSGMLFYARIRITIYIADGSTIVGLYQSVVSAVSGWGQEAAVAAYSACGMLPHMLFSRPTSTCSM